MIPLPRFLVSGPHKRHVVLFDLAPLLKGVLSVSLDLFIMAERYPGELVWVPDDEVVWRAAEIVKVDGGVVIILIFRLRILFLTGRFF